MKSEYKPIITFGILIVVAYASVFFEMTVMDRNTGVADALSVIALLSGVWVGFLGIMRVSRKKIDWVAILSILIGALSAVMLLGIASIG